MNMTVTMITMQRQGSHPEKGLDLGDLPKSEIPSWK